MLATTGTVRRGSSLLRASSGVASGTGIFFRAAADCPLFIYPSTYGYSSTVRGMNFQYARAVMACASPVPLPGYALPLPAGSAAAPTAPPGFRP